MVKDLPANAGDVGSILLGQWRWGGVHVSANGKISLFLCFACVFVFVFGHTACQSLSSPTRGPGIEPMTLHWKLRVLTTGLPGKSL